MAAEVDIWQVMCGPEVYQADLETLKQWIAEGLVQPTDQVRKGNLRWIDAGRAPALRRVFSGEESPAESAQTREQQERQPEQQSHFQTPSAQSPSAHVAAYGSGGGASPAHFGAQSQRHFESQSHSHFGSHSHFESGPQEHFDPHAADPFYRAAPGETDAPAADDDAAAFVPDQKDFAARAGAAPALRTLVGVCANHAGEPAKYVCRVCQTPFCAECPKFVDGSRVALCPNCGDFCNLFEEVRTRAVRREEKSSGFGFEDFGRAVAYPLRNLVGLVGISVFYSLLSLGGVKGQILAYIVIFGCMSLVIKQMAWGRFDRGFLPDLTAISMWDDVAVPCFLGVGITVVTIGPAIVIVLALVFGAVGGGPSHREQQAAAIEQQQEQFADDAGVLTDPNATGEEVDEALARIERRRAESMPGAAEESEDAAMARNVFASMAGSILLGLLLVAALLWAFFYYPMALIVAGYTEDFWSVVNPLVGLDTIRRMGWNYVKAFLMYASVKLVALFVGVILMLVLAPFDMPFVGNLPARFIEGGFSFYASLVVAASLGLALYKSSDRLGIETD